MASSQEALRIVSLASLEGPILKGSVAPGCRQLCDKNLETVLGEVRFPAASLPLSPPLHSVFLPHRPSCGPAWRSSLPMAMVQFYFNLS